MLKLKGTDCNVICGAQIEKKKFTFILFIYFQFCSEFLFFHEKTLQSVNIVPAFPRQ